MKSILIIALLSLNLSFHLRGQGFGSFGHDPLTLVGGTPQIAVVPPEVLTNIISLYTNIYRWWVFEDLPIGTVNSAWLDRVVGATLAQGDPTKQPTNTPSGLYFDGTGNFLTNAPLDVGGPVANALFMFILKAVDPPDGSGIWRKSGGGSSTGFRLFDDRIRYKDATDSLNLGEQTFPKNVFVNFMMHELDFYTNGVLNASHLGNNLVNNAQLDELGKDYEGTHPAKIYIKEIIIWINTGLARPLNATVRSNLQYYAVNRP